MTAQEGYFIGGHDMAEEPLHYTACGLDDVYLLNGFVVHDTEYGRGVSVANVETLHRAIGRHLVLHRKSLSPKELRFLRKQMGLTQDELASDIGVTGQTVARYEKGDTDTPGPVDLLVRFLYVLSLLPQDKRNELLDRVRDAVKSDDTQQHPARFRVEDNVWSEAAA